MSGANAYHRFARVYDRIMDDVPYEKWADYIEATLERLGVRPQRVLDLACGTGNTTLPFARRGYEMMGVDLSREMLDVAGEKAAAEGFDIEFSLQDMRNFQVGTLVDLVICLYDSLNYLLTERALSSAFRSVHRALAPGGLFMFDVNSTSKFSQVGNGTIFIETEELSLVWQNSYDFANRVWQIDLTGFLLTADGKYEKFKETHREKAYSAAEVEKALERCGFVILGIHDGYTAQPATEESRRIFFVAQKPESDARSGRLAGRRIGLGE
ncbi:MAG: class I SAM-dependent methyltransferase [Actinobacteria bacterium]|nr:class I SAM-dependent methyltransferase [Actinomycetota bacterium]